MYTSEYQYLRPLVLLPVILNTPPQNKVTLVNLGTKDRIPSDTDSTQIYL